MRIFRLKGDGFIHAITMPGRTISVWPFFVGKIHRKDDYMETRVAVMSIIVENKDSVAQLNSLLHEYGEFIIGRMGIPYKSKGISIISVALDAPQNTIAALSGKIGKLEGISVKTAYSSVITNEQ